MPYCRYCSNSMIDGDTGRPQCEITGKVYDYDQASHYRKCQHYELHPDPEHRDFYLERNYEPRPPRRKTTPQYQRISLFEKEAKK